jgi:hypothetical protein
LTLDIYVDKIFSNIEICTGISTKISPWSLDLFMTHFYAKDSVHAAESTALGELRLKYFIEDRLKGTDGNSDTVCVNAQ